MFTFFTDPNYSDHAYPMKEYSKMDYVRRRYLSELERIKTYYRFQRVRSVENQHFLCRLINMVIPSIDLDDYEYLAELDANVDFIARQFKIVSNISHGDVIRNMFYKSNSTELLLSVRNDLDMFTFPKIWREFASIRPIYTEELSIDFAIPFGDKDLKYESLSVYEIDIVAMALQYKYWAKEQNQINRGIAVGTFVAMVVLPNMLDNMLDLTIFNRLIALSYNIPLPPLKYDHPFHVLDMEDDIDAILIDILKTIEGKGYFLKQLVDTIPSIANPTMSKALFINKNIFTRQSQWALWVSRIHYINVLLRLLGKEGIAKNRSDMYALPVEVKQLERRGTDITLPPAEYQNFIDAINNIKIILGSR